MFIGGTTGGTLKDTGGESFRYIGSMTGGTLKDSGAESVGQQEGRHEEKEKRIRSKF